MNAKKIVLLGVDSDFTNAIYNHINRDFVIEKVVIEEKENKKIFLKRRLKRLGFWTVIGQILFTIFVSKALTIFSKKRIKEIITTNNLDLSAIDNDKILNVKSVNSQENIDLLKKINPDLIIVSGTRIISKKVIESVDCRFINLHAGITPKYRGVHGTYWALINNDAVKSGVTVHFVDEGIDTGNIIYQDKVLISGNDNFTTYPLLQLAAGIKILKQTVADFYQNKIVVKPTSGESNLYYHPTIFQYLKYRIFYGVK